jgi:UDP-N-acetylglucosamine 2-epimerase (non-hydrolysing)
MLKVLSLIGTRSEAVKMAPVVSELQRHPETIQSRVVVLTGRPGSLDDILAPFGIVPDYDLDLLNGPRSTMREGPAIQAGMEPVLAAEQPDWVLVHGDTTTTMNAALAAHYAGARVAHIEAGLRSFDDQNPFPEEVNRRVAAIVSDLHFAPTPGSKRHLLAEGIPANRIVVSGSSVIDALMATVRQPYSLEDGPLANLPAGRRIVLVTTRRRETAGRPLEDVCLALLDLIDAHPDIHVVYPMDPNPRIRETIIRLLGDSPAVTLMDALDYADLVQLMTRAHLVLTDSTSVQVEAPALGVPVLVLRDGTERTEGLVSGTLRLVGTERASVRDGAALLLSNPAEHARMSRAVNPYGDGYAAHRIIGAILETEVASGTAWNQPAVAKVATGGAQVLEFRRLTESAA